MEEGVLELELFEPLFGLLLDLVLDTVDVKFLLVEKVVLLDLLN